MTSKPLAALAAVALFALTSPVAAQSVADVKFQAGNFGTMVSGTVVGDTYIDYRLGAKAGQQMFVELNVTDSNGNGTVYFNILPPDSDGTAIYNSSMNGNTTTVDLPERGTYAIRVYQMGNDRDSGKTSGFTIDLSIQ
ncbi:hypothetical protein MWU54_08295 [Marivita sp. S6314]|uniref:hypothetical protein n=1 Tax=Marivita sp. S6314 TaxID=2926406 RepID=UPI001FF2CFD7|nr:hypothetical protein [Marivita sp. S6314]MCK0150017.1 hypothetical protein [Marivita sp. S6314]